MKFSGRLIHFTALLVPLLLHSNPSISQITNDKAPTTDRPAIFNAKPYIELGGSYEGLTNHYKPWDSQYIDLMLPLQERGLLYGQLQNANRFDQSDQSVYASYAYPISWGVVTVEGGYTHNPFFLAKNWYGAGWAGKLPKQFNYFVSARQSEYTDGSTLIQNLGFDKYLGPFRLAYLASYSTLNSQKSGWLSKYQAQWFFNDQDRIGFTFASGHEPAVINIGNLTTIDTQQYQLDGVYWLTSQYGVTGAVWHAKQGTYYQRNGLQIGLRIAY